MEFTKIASPANPLVRELVRVKQKPGRHKTFLIEGPHLIEMAAASPHVKLRTLLFTGEFITKGQGRRFVQAMKERSDASPRSFFEISNAVLAKLADTETPQGIVAVASYSPVNFEEITCKAAPFLVICDGVQDPGNLGTIVRVADASGADAVIILPGTCTIFNPKVVRSTAGSLFNVPIVHSGHDALAGYLEAGGISLYVTDVRAETSLYETDLRGPVALAFGSEGSGASAALLDRARALINIPIVGRAESLNVATAASVCLYEVVRQRMFS